MQRTIVLIDGNKDVRAEIDRILGANGFIAREVPTGRAALELLPELAPPVVLVLGKRLPDMSAREFVAHLNGDWRLQDAIVVMVTEKQLNPPELVAALGYAFAEASDRWERYSA